MRDRRSRARLVGRRRRPLARSRRGDDDPPAPARSPRRSSRRRCGCPSGEAVQRVYGATAGGGGGRRDRGREPVAGAVHGRRWSCASIDGTGRARRHGAARRRRAGAGVARRCRGAWAAAPSTAARSSWPATRARGPVEPRRRAGRARAAVPGAAPHDVRAALGDVAASLDVRDAARRRRGRARLGRAARTRHAGRAAAADRRDSSTRRAPTCCSRRADARRSSPRSRTGASTPKPPTVGRSSAGGPAPGARRGRRRRSVGRRRARSTPAPSRRGSCRALRAVLVRERRRRGRPPARLPAGLARPVAHGRRRAAARGRAVVRGALARRRARRCSGTRRPASSCARPRSIPAGRRPSPPARRCSPSRRRPLLSMGDRRPVGGRAGRRAGTVLVSDDRRPAARRTTISSPPGCTTPTRPTRPARLELLDVPHRRGRRVDPRARAGAGGRRARELRRDPQPAARRRALDAVGGRRASRHRPRLRRSRSGARAGFAEPRPFERRFGPSDVVVFELVRDATRRSSGAITSCSSSAPIGEAIARVARGRDRVAAHRTIEAPLVGSGSSSTSPARTPAVADELFPAGHER